MPRPTDNEVDARIDAWVKDPGNRQVHEALGWTPEEYARFEANPSDIPDRPLPAFDPDEDAELTSIEV